MIKPYVACLLMLTVLAAPVRAQEDPAPLQAILAQVPQSSSTAEITYADYRALEERRGLAPMNDFAWEMNAPSVPVWMAATTGVVGGAEFFRAMPFFDEVRDTMGFSIFEIDRSVAFGRPPANGVLLQGNFDTDAVQTALAAQGYETVDDLLCADGDCEPASPDLANINPANLFGGDLGMRRPVAFYEDDIIGSAGDANLLRAPLEGRTLDRNSFYTGMAAAFIDTGTVAQAAFFPAADVRGVDPVGILGRNAPPEQVEALRERLQQENPVPLPAYQLVGFADVTTGDTQTALVALAYTNADDAESAGNILRSRLIVGNSLVTRQPVLDIIEERGGDFGEPFVYEAPDAFIAVLPIDYPIPSNERQTDAANRVMPSSLIYRFFIQSVYSRDTAYLVSE